MGEYASYGGQQVKIGTCEDMYYLRADQAGTVRPLSGNVDPMSEEHRKHLRFRFPFPDEDGIEPGAFKDHDRSIPVHGLTVPEDVEHHTVQFHAPAGYLLSLPCPEGPAASHGLTVHRNGFAGAVRIVQQAYRGGVLAVICQCGGCGARYNLPTLEDVRPVLEACEAEAERLEREHRCGPYRDQPMDSGVAWWREVRRRIEAGYAGKA